MRYPEICKSVIDVTKAPYFADNTGKTDCTDALRRAIDDCVRGYILGIEAVRQKLLALAEAQGGGNVYVGAEAGKYIDGEVYITLPEENPPVRSLFFPDGTYLVSDTVTYTFDNLSTLQCKNYTCELCRFIQLFGESRENTVIRLADNAAGFEAGAKKPLISFNRASKEDTETTNCAQMNMLEDITVDCGRGNPGAIGVLYSSSNCGRIENVTVKGDGLFGIDFAYSSEACIVSVDICGFDYGMRANDTSPVVLQDVELSGNRIAGILTRNGNITCRNVRCGEIPMFSFLPGILGRYYCADGSPTSIGDSTGAFVFTDGERPLLSPPKMPKNEKSPRAEDWALVEDYGAVGDGVTDDTAAIQRAMNSGKPAVLFGTGTYKLERTVRIPATVNTVDFRYAAFRIGLSLIIGEMDAMFDICEESPVPFFAEHYSTGEICSGYCRLFRQSAVRTAVFRDIMVCTGLYGNTLGGSDVFFDNCFTLTAHYSQDAVLHRDGYTPVFCRTIPVEVHGQNVYGRNLNVERADTELLNDASRVLIDGYKVEGPGVLARSVNGGQTQINLFNAAWWGNKLPENPMFDVRDSQILLTGGNVFFFPEDERLCLALSICNNGEARKIYLKSCTKELSGTDGIGCNRRRLMERMEI